MTDAERAEILRCTILRADRIIDWILLEGGYPEKFLTTAQRVRNVLSILADKCRVMTYEQARNLLDSVVENSTTTNMSGDDMLKALDQAFSLRSCVIEELRLPQDDARKSITYAGMSVQDINWEMCREDMAEFLECGWLVIADEDEDFYE